MGKFLKIAAVCLTALVLVLAVSCASGGGSAQQSSSSAAGGNPWLGSWEALDKDGTIYSIEFTETAWECYLEISGLIMPFFKGTYNYSAARANLQITDELNADTMDWSRSKDTYPPMTARQANNAFKLFFTDADFKKQ